MEAELRREMSKGHVLFGRSVAAIGRRVDNDDVLFYLGDVPPRFAVVHLTYRQEKRSGVAAHGAVRLGRIIA